MTVRILQGDCRDVLKTLAENSVDAIVTDPPYHLTNSGGGPHGKGLNIAFSRARAGATSTGFMGMKWDGGDVAFQPATWAEAMRVLKPGGFLVAFGGTRTYHRLVSAIEDAGFEVRDMLAWLYGSGFPKGTDRAKIPEAWKGWNTALKPAIEPICLARKPMEGTLAENLQRWGAGALWIDGCRIALDGEVIEVTGKGALPTRHSVHEPRDAAPIAPRHPELGRWPANVLHDGSDEVLAAFPNAPGMQGPVRPNSGSGQKTTGILGKFATNSHHDPRGDTGSAARFFYCAKADRSDRNEGGADNHHPTVKPTDLMRWLCKLVTQPGGTILDPFLGSGSTLKAAELEGFSGIGIELEAAYIDIARRRVAGDAPLFASVEVQS